MYALGRKQALAGWYLERVGSGHSRGIESEPWLARSSLACIAEL